MVGVVVWVVLCVCFKKFLSSVWLCLDRIDFGWNCMFLIGSVLWCMFMILLLLVYVDILR